MICLVEAYRGSLRHMKIKRSSNFLKRNLSLVSGQSLLAKNNIKVSVMTIRLRFIENGLWTNRKPYEKTSGVGSWIFGIRLERYWWIVFWCRLPRRKFWFTRGHPVIQRIVKHPIKVHVWGCFNIRGFGRLCLFTRNLNAPRMLRLYEKVLLSSARWYGHNKQKHRRLSIPD